MFLMEVGKLERMIELMVYDVLNQQSVEAGPRTNIVIHGSNGSYEDLASCLGERLSCREGKPSEESIEYKVRAFDSEEDLPKDAYTLDFDFYARKLV